MSAARLVDDFFRHEYGRLVATLVRRVGAQHIEAVEDAAQSALMKALQTWTRAGVPEQPAAWLFRVAHNELLGELRRRARRGRLLARHADGSDGAEAVAEEPAAPLLAGEVQDDLLRMLFLCCDGSLPAASQLVLALKTLCGFDVPEIALRLFSSEASVYKRLERARRQLRQQPPDLLELTEAQISERLGTVHAVLYLMFTEGHLASSGALPIRHELCDEAIRLATVVAEHPLGRTPQTCALLALMHLHAARMGARVDAAGGLLLLEEQDRARWDPGRVQLGLQWLAQSARGEDYSRYHAEAAIAAEHCLAPSFAETRWDRVVESYALLERVSPSPLHRLGRALAVAELRGPAEGLSVLQQGAPPAWLDGSYLWSAVLSDLHRRCGNAAEAASHRDAALGSAPTAAVRELLRRRLGGGG